MASRIYFKFGQAHGTDSVAFQGPSLRLTELKKLILNRLPLSGREQEYDLEIKDAAGNLTYFDPSSVIAQGSTVLVSRVPIAELQRRTTPVVPEATPSPAPPPSALLTPPPLSGAEEDTAPAAVLHGEALVFNEAPGVNKDDERILALASEAAVIRGTMPHRGGIGRGTVVNKFAPKKPVIVPGTALYNGPASDLEKAAASVRPTRGHVMRGGGGGHRTYTGESRAEQMEKRKKNQAGIPRNFLEKPGEGEPTGGLLKVMPDESNFLEKQRDQMVSVLDHDEIRRRLDPSKVPAELQCPLSGELVRDAVVIDCCGTSFSQDKIAAALVASGFVCPRCVLRGETSTLTPAAAAAAASGAERLARRPKCSVPMLRCAPRCASSSSKRATASTWCPSSCPCSGRTLTCRRTTSTTPKSTCPPRPPR